jgi:hypothetical protein
MEKTGRVEHVASAIVLLLNMLADTFITAGCLLVRTQEIRRTIVTKDYVPHDILCKKEEIKFILQNFWKQKKVTEFFLPINI